MKSFFQKSERKYLRKKSALVHDYMIGGVMLVSFGLFINYYNDKLNPPDPADDTDSTEICNIQIQMHMAMLFFKQVQKVGVTDHYTMRFQNAVKAAKGKQYLQEAQLKQLQEEQKQQTVRVLVSSNEL